MKHTARTLNVVGLVLGFLLAASRAGAAQATTVGFDKVVIDGPGGQPLDAAFWYPSDSLAAPRLLGLQELPVAENGSVVGRGLPLIVLSHGALGSWANNADTAVALAKAGFVSAALTYDRPLRKGEPARPIRVADDDRKLQGLIDFVLLRWRGRSVVDPQKIGAFGFSLGAFTVVTALGGKPDFGLVGKNCSEEPQE